MIRVLYDAIRRTCIVFLLISIAILLQGCHVTLSGIQPRTHFDEPKIQGTLGIKILNENRLQACKRNNSLSGFMMVYNVDQRKAFYDSLLNYSREYFSNVEIAQNGTAYDYLLEADLLNTNWWGSGYVEGSQNYSVSIRLVIRKANEIILDTQSQGEGSCGISETDFSMGGVSSKERRRTSF